MCQQQNAPSGFVNAASRHDVRDLVRIFDRLFASDENTCLRSGAEEPIYQPATVIGAAHRIYCRADFFASALHEVAHWCLAGPLRRNQIDYGYWYRPDDRDEQQQIEFEAVEARPQALECLFAMAAGYRFQLSFDNLGGSGTNSSRFAAAVRAEMYELCAAMPPRAGRFRDALCHFYRTPLPMPTADRIVSCSL